MVLPKYLLVIVVFICIALQERSLRVDAAKGKKTNQDKKKVESKHQSKLRPLSWEGTLNPNQEVKSYVLDYTKSTFNDPGVEFIHDLMKVIHFKQNPPREQCRKKRFQLIQTQSNSFEGTGSLLKQIVFALAGAMHGNRVAIWGIGKLISFSSHEKVYFS